LKNEKLLATLNQIKESSVDIEKSLNESHEIRVKLFDNYNQYREICSQSASFYVGIAKIYELNPNSFTKIFLEVLDKQKDYGDLTDPFVEIVKKTYFILNRSVKRSEQSQLALNVCRCAFKKKVPDVEWEMFIFNFADAADATIDSSLPKWIKKELVPKLSSLKQQHPNFYQKLNLENDYDWRKFVDATENVQKDFPNIQVTEFQRLLIYQIFRPDQMLNVINSVTSNMLSLKSDAFIQSGIKQLLSEIESNEPILVIASNGADPTREIKEFSKNIFSEIYVGKGQETANLNLVIASAEEGRIICVKNVHLMPQFMQTVELKLKSLKIDEKFRLIYVCETDKNIPKHLANKCKKLLMEPPNGIKHKIFNLLDQNQAVVRENRDYRHMKLFVALFILHSILQERRNFIPQGWCKWYEFSDADVRAAIDFILMSSGKSFNVDWAILKGLLEKIVYGGRVDNDQDFEVRIIFFIFFINFVCYGRILMDDVFIEI
jgi:dynein heavy chain 2